MSLISKQSENSKTEFADVLLGLIFIDFELVSTQQVTFLSAD